MCIKRYKLVFFIFLVVTGCGVTPKPPKITNITIPDSLLVNQKVPVQVDVISSQDYGPDKIKFDWQAERGEISSSQDYLVTYVAPPIHGFDKITVSLKKRDTDELLAEYSKAVRIVLSVNELAPPDIITSTNPPTVASEVTDVPTTEPTATDKLTVTDTNTPTFTPTSTNTPTDTPTPIPTNKPIDTPTPVTPTLMPLFSALHIEDCDGKKKFNDCTSEQDETTTQNQNDWLIRWKPWNPPTNFSSHWFYLISFFSGNNNEPILIKMVSQPDIRDGWLTYSIDQEDDLLSDTRGCWPYWDVVVATNDPLELCPTKYVGKKSGFCLITELPASKRALGTSHTNSCPGGGGGSGGGGSQLGRPVFD